MFTKQTLLCVCVCDNVVDYVTKIVFFSYNTTYLSGWLALWVCDAPFNEYNTYTHDDAAPTPISYPRSHFDFASHIPQKSPL